MSRCVNGTRVLIASDERGAADLVLENLQGEFEHVRVSTELAQATRDFEEWRPEVVVLAFDRLASAQRYCRVLEEGGRSGPRIAHRMVMLCNRRECEAVVDLCRQEQFDDYVLYWPQPYDGFRLAVSIRSAGREMAALRAPRCQPMDLLGRAQDVEEFDRVIDTALGGLERRANAVKQALLSTESEITIAIDAFSRRLGGKEAAAYIEVKDGVQLAQQIDRLRDQQIETVRRSSGLEIEAMRGRARSLRDKLEPALAGARALVDEIRKLRPVVMVVEDDDFARALVGRALDPERWETVFARDGAEALGLLKRLRPDVILMDVRLPGIDGMSLTTQLRSSPHFADIPVIMMTGDARKETLLGSIAAGARGFVVKPFTRAVLTAKLEKVFPQWNGANTAERALAAATGASND